MWCIILITWFGEPSIHNHDTVLFWGVEKVGCHILMEVGEDDLLHVHILAPHVTATCMGFRKRWERLMQAKRPSEDTANA